MRGSERHPRWQLNVMLTAGLLLCAFGFRVELGRGLAGHLPAWVYVFEWPFFAVCGVVLWWRLIRDEPHDTDESAPLQAATTAPEDPELLAWQDYVARFTAAEKARQRPDESDIT